MGMIDTSAHMVIDFVRGGREHRAVTWTSDRELRHSAEYITGLKGAFTQTGAEVISIRAVEPLEVELLG